MKNQWKKGLSVILCIALMLAFIINARRVYKFAVCNEMTDIFRAIHTELSCFTVDLL